jgi:hypothetical protein
VPKQQRKVVFFLGAGASYGAGAFATVQKGGRLPIPMQSKFWSIFLRFCHSTKNRQQIESFLFRYFMGYDRIPARMKPQKRREMLSGVDVEEVFTFLSERARAPSTSPQLRTEVIKIWRDLVSELPNVFVRFAPNKQTRAVYRSLTRNLWRSRDTFVSFNYDTVFEKSLPQSQSWHYEGIEDKPNSLRILKPHGSINWEASNPIKLTKQPERALIVAPTHLKFIQSGTEKSEDTIGYLNNSEGINAVWKKMEGEMRKARALIFIGYSFPVADLYFSSVLRSVLTDRAASPAITIVNPDAVAIRRRLCARFSLKPENIDVHYDIRNFSEVLRKDWLGRLSSLG